MDDWVRACVREWCMQTRVLAYVCGCLVVIFILIADLENTWFFFTGEHEKALKDAERCVVLDSKKPVSKTVSLKLILMQFVCIVGFD
jgi:hypothetical protein